MRQMLLLLHQAKERGEIIGPDASHSTHRYPGKNYCNGSEKMMAGAAFLARYRPFERELSIHHRSCQGGFGLEHIPWIRTFLWLRRSEIDHVGQACLGGWVLGDLRK